MCMCVCPSVCRGRRGRVEAAKDVFCGCRESLGDRTLCTTNPLKISAINKHFHFSNYCHPLLSAQGPTFCFLWRSIACCSGKSHLQVLGQAWAHTSNPRVQALTPASGMSPEEGYKVLCEHLVNYEILEKSEAGLLSKKCALCKCFKETKVQGIYLRKVIFLQCC